MSYPSLRSEFAAPELVECLLAITQYFYLAAQPIRAMPTASKAVEHVRRLDNPRLLRKALNVHGLICVETGNLPDATASFSEALSVARSTRRPRC